jgi:hypothetical protein
MDQNQFGNPYQSPATTQYGYTSGESGVPFTSGALSELARTKGWALFVGIMFIIMGVFIMIGGLMFLVVGSRLAGLGSGFPAFIALLYLVMGAVYMVPGVLACKYSSAIGRVTYGRQGGDLESAMRIQRKIWLFFGIMFILMILLFFIGMVASFSMTPKVSRY